MVLTSTPAATALAWAQSSAVALLSTRRQFCVLGKLAESARSVAPIPQPRSTIEIDEQSATASAIALRTSELRARTSYGARNASQPLVNPPKRPSSRMLGDASDVDMRAHARADGFPRADFDSPSRCWWRFCK